MNGLSSSTTIDSLPEEVMVEIFKYFDNKEFLTICFVNKYWRNLSWLYRPEINTFRVEDENVEIFMERSPNIQSLILRDCDVISKEMYLTIFDTLKNLKRLDLCFAREFNDECAKNLVKLSYLERFFISESPITDNAIVNITQLKHLISLGFVGMPYLTNIAIFNLEPIATQLKRLNIGFCKFSDESIRIIATMINLNELLITRCDDITDWGLAYLTLLTNLRKIDIATSSNFSSNAKNILTRALPKLDVSCAQAN